MVFKKICEIGAGVHDKGPNVQVHGKLNFSDLPCVLHHIIVDDSGVQHGTSRRYMYI